MIICFSGVGNSRHVADQLQSLLGDSITRPAPGSMNDPRLFTVNTDDKRIIWVFPIHAWGLPITTREMMEQMQLDAPSDCVHHMVATCGDDLGYADKHWRAVMAKRGWESGNAYSVQMPNTYTAMRGFDIDSAQLQAQKLAAMPDRVKSIVQGILERPGEVDVVRGAYPWLKSKVLHPWFMRFMTNARRFHATNDCMSCGKCQRNCPRSNISLVDGRPRWGKECTMCLRCYHVCPNHAVHYGRATKSKGQYMCPGFSIKD